MELKATSEPPLLLPPWPVRRRRLAALIMIGFILLASGLIGVGIYQIGIEKGVITPPLNKERITQLLLSDASFVRAVKLAGQRRECVNTLAHFKLSYEAPFKPLSINGVDACFSFVAMHPTGADVLVTINSENTTRDQLVTTISSQFSSIQADLISGVGYETSRLYGLRDNIPTVIYIIRTEPNKSWVITYAPTSPNLDMIVQRMVEQFQIF